MSNLQLIIYETIRLGVELDKIEKVEKEQELNFMPDKEFILYENLRRKRGKVNAEMFEPVNSEKFIL